MPDVGTEWAALVRVSHLGGRGGESFHADRDQLDAIKAHAKAHGANLHILPPELNVSGGLPLEKRPSLMAAIEGVEQGKYDAIVVAYLSRLGRNLREQLRAWDRVEAAGGRIILVQEGIDTRTRAGRLHRNFLLSIAQDEREMHAERFAQLREWATTAGIWQRRQTPLGYSRDPKTRKLVPSRDATKVQRAFRDRIAGRPIVQIADRLGMTPSGTRQLLKNRVYLGELRVGEHVNPSAHPPLVDLETFEAAQTGQARPPRQAKSPALLAGLVRCAGCGHVMSRTKTAREVYSCHGRHSGGRCLAPAAVTVARLDELVTGVALPELRKLAVTARAGRNLDAAKQRLTTAEAELGAYLEAVSALAVDQSAIHVGAVSRQRAVDGARQELRGLLAAAPMLPGTNMDELWEGLDAHGRNGLLRALLEAVVVERAGGRGARTPLTDRVRIVKFGTGLIPERAGGGVAMGLHPIALPNPDDPCVLRVPDGE